MAVTQPPVSPSSSPRLPSPPPLTEVQFGPRSPSLGGDNKATTTTMGIKGDNDLGGSNSDEAIHTRRIRPGSKAEDMGAGPPLIPLSDLESAFQLQEHLQALYLSHTLKETHTVPISRSIAHELASPPDGIDRSLWLYELVRLLTRQLNIIIVAFFTDDPPCSSATCPEMRASEWQYLCAVHDPPKPCCAIDYSCHTLDWAANMLTSSKHFPSRLSLGSSGVLSGGANGTEGGGLVGQQQQGLRNLTNICRRLYRIFAHAWYQHRSVFWQVESQTGLYVFFKTVCDLYQLIPEDNYTIPAEAEGVVENNNNSRGNHVMEGGNGGGGGGARGIAQLSGPTILRKQGSDHPGMFTTRRHMTSLSVGSLSGQTGMVATVPEEGEGENEAGVDNAKREIDGGKEDGGDLKRPKTRRAVEDNKEQQMSQDVGRREEGSNEGGQRDRSDTVGPSRGEVGSKREEVAEVAEGEKMEEKQEEGSKDGGDEGKDSDGKEDATTTSTDDNQDDKTEAVAATDESQASNDDVNTTVQGDNDSSGNERIDVNTTALGSTTSSASENDTAEAEATELKPTPADSLAVDEPRSEDEGKNGTNEQAKDKNENAVESEPEVAPSATEVQQPAEDRREVEKGEKDNQLPESDSQAELDASITLKTNDDDGNEPSRSEEKEEKEEKTSEDHDESDPAVPKNTTDTVKEDEDEEEEGEGNVETKQEKPAQDEKQKEGRGQGQLDGVIDNDLEDDEEEEDEEEGDEEEEEEEEGGDEKEGDEEETGAGAILVKNDEEKDKMDGMMRDAGVL
ncbi:MAG: hypothetical protein M1823_006133 [Watsoniomyces obsoletus]|nr:MAG: hypothetical protein M1823_006133 [Watsoniomyces obsoletus]